MDVAIHDGSDPRMQQGGNQNQLKPPSQMGSGPMFGNMTGGRNSPMFGGGSGMMGGRSPGGGYGQQRAGMGGLHELPPPMQLRPSFFRRPFFQENHSTTPGDKPGNWGYFPFGTDRDVDPVLNPEEPGSPNWKPRPWEKPPLDLDRWVDRWTPPPEQLDPGLYPPGYFGDDKDPLPAPTQKPDPLWWDPQGLGRRPMREPLEVPPTPVFDPWSNPGYPYNPHAPKDPVGRPPDRWIP